MIGLGGTGAGAGVEVIGVAGRFEAGRLRSEAGVCGPGVRRGGMDAAMPRLVFPLPFTEVGSVDAIAVIAWLVPFTADCSRAVTGVCNPEVPDARNEAVGVPGPMDDGIV